MDLLSTFFIYFFVLGMGVDGVYGGSCTWNSLQPPVGCTTTQLFKTLDHFNALSIYPSTLLIDDGWQDVHDLKLRSFDSRHEFLDGMKDLGEVVRRAKEGGVLNVGVWHTIGGYWQGVDPLRFKDEYKLIKVTKVRPHSYLLSVSDERVGWISRPG